MKLIEQKKKPYPISAEFRDYLAAYSRVTRLPIEYADLKRFTSAVALYDKNGEDTLWSTVGYDAAQRKEVHKSLLEIYAILRSEGDLSVMEHLAVDRIDLCLYGNSQPFRIRIINSLNDNFDYFYVKLADASRLYGLELEEVLSPNRIGFLVHGDTLIEEHIYGIPGDMFINKYMQANLNEVRLAKEFVKFNERCFLRLLGDMHSANFVVDIHIDFEENNYRMRAIDFDQQSYEPRCHVYLPQYYKENNPIIALGMKHLTWESVRQYQHEERSLIHRRMRAARRRYDALMVNMERDRIAPDEYVAQLGDELAAHYSDAGFGRAKTMGELVRRSLATLQR